MARQSLYELYALGETVYHASSAAGPKTAKAPDQGSEAWRAVGLDRRWWS
jgi:hypothetical protein